MPTQSIPHATRTDAWLVEPEKLRLVIDPAHPLYDPRVEMPLDPDFVRNIAARGVLKSVLVRKDGDILEVIDGRQRVRAAREANKLLRREGKPALRVPVFVRRGDDRDMYGVLVAGNVSTQADGPMAKARKAKRLVDMGYSEDEIAVTFGVVKQTVRNWLASLSAAPVVRQAVEAGKLAPTAAAKLSRLPREKQAAAVAELGERPTVQRAQRIAAGGNGRAEPRARPVAEVRRLYEATESGTAHSVLGWVLGHVEDDVLAKREPGLKRFFETRTGA